MSLSEMIIYSTPTVYTVQAPTISFDYWGNAVVNYKPLRLSSYFATFPTAPCIIVFPEETVRVCSTKVG